MMKILKLRVDSNYLLKFWIYIIVLCLFITFGICYKKQSHLKDSKTSVDIEQSKRNIPAIPGDSLRVHRVRNRTIKALHVEMQDVKGLKKGKPIGFGDKQKKLPRPMVSASITIKDGRVVYQIDPEGDLYKLINLTDEQFDSIPELENPLNMIVKEKTLFYLWPPVLAEMHLYKDQVIRTIKKYKDYYFIKKFALSKHTGKAYTGWVKEDVLKGNLDQNIEFTLEFVMGDSMGSGVLNAPVRVSSDEEGNIYVIDVDRTLEYRIHKFSEKGDFISFIEMPIVKEQGKQLMKVKGGYLFVFLEGRISRYTLDGRKVGETLKGLVRPVALDIDQKGNIYVVDNETPPRREGIDISVKVYSPEGRLLLSFAPKNFKNPTDIKVKDNKIYLAGKKEKIKENIVFTIKDTISLYSDEGFPISKIGKGERLELLKVYKRINNRSHEMVINQEGDTGFVDIESKNLIECDANVVYILDRYGNKLDEITSRNIAQGLNIELSEEMAKGRYGSYYKWKRITVDEEENLYVLLDANFMNGGGCRLIEFDNKGNINQEILYSSEYWIYQGSNRSFKIGIGDTDLEYYKEGSVLLIENGELYRIHDSKIQKAVEDIPHEALFDNPTAIEVDKNGNIYVSDFTLNKIKKYKPSGELIWSIGGYGKENGRFYCVGDLAVDDAGFLYATDNGNDRLQKFDSDGEFVSSFSVEPLYMYGTSFDIIVSGEKLKITEGNKVHIFNKDGELIEKRKSNIKMRIGSTFDKDNNLWTFDNTPFGPIIRVFDPQGEIIDGFTNYDFKGSLKTISDLKFDSQGNLWVVDTGSYQVKKYSIKWN